MAVRIIQRRGTDAELNRLPVVDGQLLYAYDSGFIYIDKGNTRYALGGNDSSEGGSSFLWADAEEDETLFKVDPETTADPFYNMSIYALETISEDDENPIYPQTGLLVINSDGRFFRIIDRDFEHGLLNLELIAVSGTGGGGGGYSGVTVTLTPDTSTISNGQTYVYGQEQYITVTARAVNGNPDTTMSLYYTFTNNVTGEIIYDTVDDATSGVPYDYDISELPACSDYTITITANSTNSGLKKNDRPTVEFVRVKVVEMGIKKASNAYLPLVMPDDATGTLTLQYIPYCDASLGLTLHVFIDGIENQSLMREIDSGVYNRTLDVAIPRQSHGVHTIDLKLSTVVGRKNLFSNTVTYEGGWAARDNDAPIIWIGAYDPTVINYETSYIQYMVYDPVNYRNGLPAEIHLYKDGKEVSQIEANYSNDNWLVWDISDLYEVGKNVFTVACRTISTSLNVDVTTKGSRNLSLVSDSALLLNLTAAGRSSSEIKSQRDVFNNLVENSTATVALNNFNWQNNGWKESEGPDAQGVDSGSFLSIANGASMNINLGGSGLSLNQAKDYTFEMRFRVRNVQKFSTLIRVVPRYFYMVPDPEAEDGWRPMYSINEDGEVSPLDVEHPSYKESEIEQLHYKIGVDEYGNLLMDEERTTKEPDITSGVVVKWLNNDGYGFCIGTQEAYFRSRDGVANVRYCEDEVINLSIVVSKTNNLCYIYLNGILSGVAKLPTGAGASFVINTPFEFNSDYCDFDLYRFRIYEIGLTMPNVIHNYLSDMRNIKLYDQNQITDPLDPTALSYDLLLKYNSEHPDELSMPYATWQITDGQDQLLPWKKGNNRKATIEFVNPTLDRLLETGKIDEWTYYTHCPSYTAQGVDINVQGTSSQKYPRRNYKTKFKDAKKTWVYTKGSLAGLPLTEDYTVLQTKDAEGRDLSTPIEHTLGSKFHMDVDTYGINKFTWKIDYMESSESYNTGFANLMGNKVHPLYSKHPLDDYNINLGDLDTNELRSCVYGFPVLTFHKYSDGTDSNGEAKYLYEYIGKYVKNVDKGADEAFGYGLKEKQPYVEPRIRKIKNADNQLVDEVYQPTIKEIAECWDTRDNQGTWCSFKYPNPASRNTGFMTLKEGTSGDNAKLEIIDHFEYRYSFYADEFDAAYEYTAFTDGNSQVEYSNNGQINNYLYEKYHNFELLFNWLDSTDQNTATNRELTPPVVYNTASYVTNDPTVDYEILLNNVTQLAPGTAYAEFDEVQQNGKTVQVKINYFVRKNDNYWFYEYDPSNWDTKVAAGEIYTAPLSGLYKATFHNDTKEYRRQKFRAEFAGHFDKEYCLTYFVLTELLLCYDSRGKNMQVASYGPQSCSYVIDNEVTADNYLLRFVSNGSGGYTPANGDYDANTTYYRRIPGNYIWYPCFYDIDTQLGLNNSGAYLWDYDADVTKDNLFSTPTSVLWVNLYDVFYDDIVQKYRVLRGISNPSNAADTKINGSLTRENIIGSYEYVPSVFSSYAMQGVRPIIAIGLDEYYKYMAPALKESDFNAGKLYAGYYDTTGTHQYQASPTYAYCAQGDKQLTTELLVRNRLNYIDSQWLGGDYRAGVVENQIFIRANANHSSTSDTYLDSPETPYPMPYFDARPGAKIKPFLHQYVSYFHDNLPSVPVKYDGSGGQEDGVWTNVDTAKLEAYKNEPDLSQQIVYIPGGDYISSLGDISLMYPNSLQIFHGQRLLDFKLGSDIPGYSNPLITSSSDWELAAMPLLTSVNICRLNAFNRVLDLTASAKLQEFRALGSIIESVQFASGAPLHTVHLPQTIAVVSLIQNENLTDILTSRPVIVEGDLTNGYTYTDPATYRGLYIEGVTDYQNANAGHGHKLSTYEVQGGGLKYKAYTILKNLYDLKNGASNDSSLGISLTDMQWSPYEIVEVGESYHDGISYYYLTDHSTFVSYTYDSATWNNDVLNGRIFTKNSSMDETTITSLDLLDAFIEEYLDAQEDERASQFANITGSASATIPTITGELYVHNPRYKPYPGTLNAELFAEERDDHHLFIENSGSYTEVASDASFDSNETYYVDGRILEDSLTDVYKAYFPGLTIYVNNIKEANLSRYVRTYADGREEVLTTERSSESTPRLPTGPKPSWLQYDFLGFSLTNPWTDPDYETGNADNIDLVLKYNSSNETYTTTSAWDALHFDDNNTSITFYAVFELHKFSISYDFGDGEDPIICLTAYSLAGPLNTPEKIPYKVYDKTDMESIEIDGQPTIGLYGVYKFMGWALSTVPTTVVDLADYHPTRDYEFTAVYAPKSVYDNVADEQYFEILNDQLMLKTGCTLSGKITIPRTIGGQTYTSIGASGWSGNDAVNAITHIFFEKPAEGESYTVEAIRNRAFANHPTLQFIETPDSVTSIGNQAFYDCPELLKQDNADGYECLKMIGNVTSYGTQMMQGILAHNYNAVHTINLGTIDHVFANASDMSMGVFSGCPNVTKIIVGDSAHLSAQTVANIRNNVFSGAIGGSNPNGTVDIWSAIASDLVDAFDFPGRFTTINTYTSLS